MENNVMLYGNRCALSFLVAESETDAGSIIYFLLSTHRIAPSFAARFELADADKTETIKLQKKSGEIKRKNHIIMSLDGHLLSISCCRYRLCVTFGVHS